MKPFFITFLSAVLFFGFIQPDQARADFAYPDYDNIYVNDYAGVLDSETEDMLLQYLQQSEATSGAQITLLTIQRLSDYGAGPTIEPFATGLFNHWGVGDAVANDGVLILVAVTDRKMRIELGSGYSRDQDSVMKNIIDHSFIPYFRDDEYQEGIRVGTIETIRVVTGVYPGEIGNSFFARTKFKVMRLINDLGAGVLAIIAPIFLGIFALLRKLWRMRPRKCGVCQNKMVMMGESADDAHLDGGQRLEEYLKSVDYDVWQCTLCSRIDIFRYRGLFSKYRTCKSCNYRTLRAETTVLTAATTSSTGTKRIDYDCQNCDFTDYETRTIPKLSSSSSSSGGSFGGGSSSGGGASGSW